ncbi:hypothetical protein ZIOFF_004638 [Zingiber officinale]|uniref:FAD-binding PCMH-type domain-containing protein n=1 Tax=Zingiber officinale TaxID=94328 RepID=A0A8J5M0W4_ZINOF|nr:hypothetical protein ZIOFF_004638 [Zingiber officinale]
MAGRLVLAVNTERFELAKVDPSTTLLEFLRTRTRFTGPKLGCGEDKADGPEPPIGFSKITKFEAQKSISGNLCRCTGYRPIADVCKSFAADVDLEDLGLNTFWNNPDYANVDRLPPHNQGQICTFPEFLKSDITSSIGALESCQDSGLPECQWYRPSGLEQLYKLLNSDEFTENQVKLVMGNTGSGVYKENDLYDKYIDLTGIPELLVVKRDSKGITLGAAVTISRVIEVLKEKDNTVLHSGGKLIFCKMADHMDKVASPFIRNMASLGGNLIMAQRNQFASDIATILLAVGSIVCFQTSSGRLIISLEEFLKLPPCDDRTILISIHIPYWSSDIDSSSATSNAMVSVPKSDSSILFETYRAAPRPLGNAVSYLNSAFLVHVISDKISGDLILLNLHLAFGSYGSEHAIRARKVEEFLTGKILTASILLGVIHLLKETIIPKVGTRHSRYRASLAITFLFNFFQPLAKELVVAEKINHVDLSSVATHYPNDKTNGSEDIMEPRTSKFEQLCNPSIILSSKQLVEFSTDYDPIGVPIKKVGAEIQASGKVSILNDGSVVVEVGGVEIGQGLWTKVKQMVAFVLGQLWEGASLNLLDRLRIIQVDSLSLIQASFTGGSTKSESSCEAVRLASSILVSRLKPLKQSLEEQMGSISWDTLISQATMQAVNLSASAFWVPENKLDYLNYGAAISGVEVDILTGATTILRTDLTYDCGQSLNPAVDLGQIEGAFVQGIGFFLYEEHVENSDGLVVSDSTWTYKIPTIDTIPKQFNVKLMKSGHHEKRLLSSKASGEPPLLLASSVHCAVREAIRAARAELSSNDDNHSASTFQLDVPATMPVVKELCGLNTVEKYLETLVSSQGKVEA